MTDHPTTGPDEIKGAYGAACRVPRTHYTSESPATLDAWVITAPTWHPLWSQYLLAVITLADMPGVGPAFKDRSDVTHQVIVMAMDPDHGPYTPDSFAEKSVRYLSPGNIGAQFTADDGQALELSTLLARAVVDGVLCPETADAPSRIRAEWARSIQLTLDHARDPHHGAMN